MFLLLLMIQILHVSIYILYYTNTVPRVLVCKVMQHFYHQQHDPELPNGPE